MDIGDDIDIVYYNGTGSGVVEEGFLCYLNQVAYGLSIPLTFFQKGVMNTLMCCPGQLNGNIFEMMRVCEDLNQKWRDGGIARQFVADDVLKYYKFKYAKDQKSGYLFSDLARPKFFDFESFGRPWCDHLVMGVNLGAVEQEALDFVTRDPIRLDTQIRSSISQLSVAWKSAAEVLKLAAANRAKLVQQYDAEKAALQEQFEADVNLALAGKYGEIVFPGDDTSLVAEQTPAPPVDDDSTKEEVVHLRGKVIEMEKALSRARDSINRTQQDKRFLDESDKLECQRSLLSLRLYFEAEVDSKWGLKEAYLELLTERDIVPDPARVKFLAQEARNRHSRVAQRCSTRAGVSIIWGGVDTQQRLQVSQSRLKKIITPKRGKRAANTNHERQMANVIAFYGSELKRVQNEFRRYISSCGKDLEVENDKAEDKDNDNVAALSASNKKLSAKLQQCLLAVERKTLLNSKLESEILELQSRLNAVTVELSSKDAEILTANNESKQWKESLKKKKLETMAANQQVLDLLNSEIRYMRERLKKLNWDLREALDSCQRKNDCAKAHEEACSKRDRELREAINKCNSRIPALDREMQALVQEYIQGNEVFEELHAKYNESQRMMDAAKNEINFSRKEKKSLEARCKELDDELNKVKTKFYEVMLLTAGNVTLRAMAMLHADVEKFRTERESILAAIIEYVTEYDLQLARLSYIDNLMLKVIELLNAPSTVVDATSPSPVLLSSGPGESLNVISPKREQ
ncbi:hypothetical protein GIB67_009774 [Kingdonia uniflora]|uniref:Uncharacterized protein n=1 Tax=Kingdonia uniflora TaxID=39325 RepID=A0A7J7LXB1_9MAGN|nr:hypothetical protein GIB67_009774 [Kingdonia uniflora]